LNISLVTAVTCMIGMIVTSMVPNQYVAATSAFFSFIIIDKLELIFHAPAQVKISNIISGLITITDNAQRTIFYIVLLVITVLSISSVAFSKVMKWRCCFERD